MVVATKDHHVDPGAPLVGATPTSSTPGRCTARSAPTARRSTPTSTRSPSTRSSSRASTRRRTPASRAPTATAARSPTGCAATRWTQVDVCGIATDHCVRATALDAVERGVRHPGAHRPVRRRRAGDDRARAGRDARGRRARSPEPQRARVNSARRFSPNARMPSATSSVRSSSDWPARSRWKAPAQRVEGRGVDGLLGGGEGQRCPGRQPARRSWPAPRRSPSSAKTWETSPASYASRAREQVGEQRQPHRAGAADRGGDGRGRPAVGHQADAW